MESGAKSELNTSYIIIYLLKQMFLDENVNLIFLITFKDSFMNK